MIAPAVAIRSATDADIETLRALAGAIWREYYAGILSAAQIDYMLDRMYSPGTIRRELSAGVTWEVVVAPAAGDEPVGYLSFSIDLPVLHLHKLYLVPRLHGQGLGRRLLDHVRDRAVRAGARTIRLQVNKQNARAIRAYERAGFHTAAAIVSDIGGGFVMDDYVMTIDVEPPGSAA